MTVSSHPTRSPEFLSRLRDGELSAEERRLFEAHRGECAECRETVAAFARSLDAFRSAPEPPAPADLAARILRKIRAQSPSRRPFGVMFGIDIRWAGVFLAALLVAIIAPGLFSGRRETRAASAPQEPLTAYVVDSEPSPDRPGAPAPAPGRPASPPAPAPAPPHAKAAPEAAEEGLATRDKADAASPVVVTGEAPLLDSAPVNETASRELPRKEAAQRQAQNAAPSAMSRRTTASASGAPAERQGGEAGFLEKEEKSAAADVHLDIRAFDTDGTAPELSSPNPPTERLAPLRGRDFVLTVDANGVVQSVLPARREDERTRSSKDADAESALHGPLKELRFRATGRPRRLFVRVR